MEGRDFIKEWRVNKNRSNECILEGLGRTLGRSASILVKSVC